MRRLLRVMPAVTAALILAAGVATPAALAFAGSARAVVSLERSTETSMPNMPGMDHASSSPTPAKPETDSHEGRPTPDQPGMDHEKSPMPGMDMPGSDHSDGAVSRPRGLLLGGFGALNATVLIAAAVLRRRTRAERDRRRVSRSAHTTNPRHRDLEDQNR